MESFKKEARCVLTNRQKYYTICMVFKAGWFK